MDINDTENKNSLLEEARTPPFSPIEEDTIEYDVFREEILHSRN